MYLVVNAGSSSLKFQLFQVHGANNFQCLVHGLFERIGLTKGRFVFKSVRSNFTEECNTTDHLQAVNHLFVKLFATKHILDFDQILGVGHRYVNAGEKLTQSCLVTNDIVAILETNIDLAPLHNPGGIMVLKALRLKIKAPHVIVFDTGFHDTIPQVNYLYPVPWEWYDKYAVRRYGAHGISYRYIVQAFCQIKKITPEGLNAIICHLGNGASVCAVKNGVSVNTSMGFTPLEGLMMGSRSGDLDPTIGEYLHKITGMTPHEFSQALNKKSGLIGVSELSSDIRDLDVAARKNNWKAQLALKMFVQRICRYISYYQNEFQRGTKLNIIFTAGIGENASCITNAISDQLKTLSLHIDPVLNDKAYDTYICLNPYRNQQCDVYKMRTNEEFIICQDIYRLTNP